MLGPAPCGEYFRRSWLPICMTEEAFLSAHGRTRTGRRARRFQRPVGTLRAGSQTLLALARFARIRHRCGARYPLLLPRLAV